MDTDTTDTAPARILNMRQAAKLAKLSEVTMRKHLKLGRLKGIKADGPYGQTWEIDYEALAEFVQARYGRRLSLRATGRDTAQPYGVDTLRQLRDQLDTALVDLGRYKQLAESTETTAAEVERLLKERIAEVQAERDAAQAEAARLAEIASAGWWQRRRLLRAARSTTPGNGATT